MDMLTASIPLQKLKVSHCARHIQIHKKQTGQYCLLQNAVQTYFSVVRNHLLYFHEKNSQLKTATDSNFNPTLNIWFSVTPNYSKDGFNHELSVDIRLIHCNMIPLQSTERCLRLDVLSICSLSGMWACCHCLLMSWCVCVFSLCFIYTVLALVADVQKLLKSHNFPLITLMCYSAAAVLSVPFPYLGRSTNICPYVHRLSSVVTHTHHREGELWWDEGKWMLRGV